MHLQEHFTRLVSSVLDRTCGISSLTALQLTEFLAREISGGKTRKRHTSQHEYGRQSKQKFMLEKFICCS